MSAPGEASSSSSRPLPVPIVGSPGSGRGPSQYGSVPRAASIARLASPVPSNHLSGTPNVRQIPTPNQGQNIHSGSLTPLAGDEAQAYTPGPGISALAAALSNSIGTSPPRFGTPPLRPLSPATAGQQIQNVTVGSHPAYGSFDPRPRSVQGNHAWAGSNAYEDPEVVRRHLVQPSETHTPDIHNEGIFGGPSMSMRGDSPASRAQQDLDAVAPGLDDNEFSSLRLQGGDITRPIYKWSEEAQRGRNQRSQSFHMSRPYPEDETLDISAIKVPGGMRRNYLRRAAPSPSPVGRPDEESTLGIAERRGMPKQKLLTSNFIEFLTLYGHFAGEELEEDDEALEPDEYFSGSHHDEDRGISEAGDGSDDDREPMESSALLTPGRRRRKRKTAEGSGNNTSMGAALLLLKSFVGTGVLFLPRAYLNGGMGFSNLVLLFVAILSYYCFVLLVNTRNRVNGSFGDIGGMLYGRWMRSIILFQIVLSQIGFVAAYIVFTSENLKAFVLAVSDCKTNIPVKYLILMQMAVFLPFSLLRDISKLAFTALIADALILLGLAYLYYFNIFTIATQGVADIVAFNKNDWTLFIGTAIFTFEGIGLIIPIQESMRNPKQFPGVLAGVMVIITTVFLSMGALSYAAYGSKTETVVILNLPQDDKFVNAVQFMYSLAILLSTPLQIFPAIRILETELFTRSGKYNPYIKWQKNIFRFVIVMMCAAIAWGGAGDLDKFVALVGSFACVPLVYIYPPMLHYKAVAKTSFRKTCDILLAIFGIVVMAYTTTLTILSWATGGGVPETHGGYCDPVGNLTSHH